MNPAEVIAETLTMHADDDWGKCRGCGWKVDETGDDWDAQFVAHQASVIATLPNIAVVPLPEPVDDDTVHPYWAVDDVAGSQQVRVADSDGSCDENWVKIEFTARWRTVDAETAEQLGSSLLAAAAHARRNQ